MIYFLMLLVKLFCVLDIEDGSHDCYTVIINVAHLCVTNVKEPWGNWVCTSAMGRVETANFPGVV